MNLVDSALLTPELIGGRPAPGVLALVQAFINSVDLEAGVDRIGDLDGFTRWLILVGLATPTAVLTERDRHAAIRLREAIRALARDRESAAQLERESAVQLERESAVQLERAIDGLALTLTYRDGAFRTTSTTALGGALGPIVDALQASINNGTWLRFKVCARDRCQWLFYDNSRNQGSHWCTTNVCGSREKARRAYARSTGQPAKAEPGHA